MVVLVAATFIALASVPPAPDPDRAVTGVVLLHGKGSSLMNIPQTVLRLGVPLLWAVGTRDRNLVEKGRAYAFARATGAEQDRHAEVTADHRGTPDAATSAVLAWMSEVAPTAAAAP
jgi:hypothetical protein